MARSLRMWAGSISARKASLPNLPLRLRRARVRACYDGSSTVPEDVRKQRPWQGDRRDVEALKPEYRLALDRDGYVLVKCEHAVFKPEMCSA